MANAKQALHDALDDIGVDARSSCVIGLAVEHRGVEMTLGYRPGESKPWTAYTYIEQPLQSEPKLIEAVGRSPDDALDGCADAAEEAEGFASEEDDDGYSDTLVSPEKSMGEAMALLRKRDATGPRRRTRTYPLVGDTWSTKQGVRLTVVDAGPIYLQQFKREVVLRCACGAERRLTLRTMLASYIFVKRAPKRRRARG